MTFLPYWLIHEPGKEHGIATVDLDSAGHAEKAVEVWRNEARAEWAGLLDVDAIEVTARLITEPFVS